MKTKTAINIIVFVLAVIGVFFKHMHWPGGNAILGLSYLCLFYLLFRYALPENKESGLSQFLNYTLTVALAVFIFTLMFKSMHWPGAQIFSIASTILVVIASGAIVFSTEGLKVSKQYVMILFVFILLLDGLLHRTGWSKLPGIQGSEQDVAVAIAPTKMNVLYMGIDNPLTIVASGIDNNKLEVKTDNGTVTGGMGHFIVNPKNSDLPANIKVLDNGKEIGSAAFRVKLVPEPVATVAGISSGTLSKDLLLAQKGVEAVLPDFAFDLTFKVTEFMLITNDGKYTKESVSKSDQFTQEQLEMIKKVKKDSRITIEAIKAVGPDGMIRDLKPIIFKIK